MRKFLIIVIVLLVLWLFCFLTDYLLVLNSHRPLFVIYTAIYQDGGSYEACGLGYKIIGYTSTYPSDKLQFDIGFWNMEFDDKKSDRVHEEDRANFIRYYNIIIPKE